MFSLRNKVPKMLQELNPEQVESALQWLASPLREPPPQDLRHLQELEWFLLERMLESLMLEKRHNPLQ